MNRRKLEISGILSLVLYFSVLVFLVSTETVTEAQISVVQKYRALYPTPLGANRVEYEANTVKLLKSIAGEVRGGILRKSSGNNCQGYSCDFICFSDGRGFDVLIDAENRATPTWSGPQPINASNCELVTTPVPPNPPETPPSNETTALLKEIRDILKDIRTLLQ